MSNVQDVSESAAKWAREQLVYKSSNKARLTEPAATRVAQSMFQQKQVERQAEERLQSMLKLVESQLEAAYRGQELAALTDVLASKAGNCSAYSILALAYIHAHEPKWTATRVSLEGSGGDHVFVAVADFRFNVERFDKDMKSWPEKVWICDPWANVVCPANTYYESFERQMKKWSTQHKRILYQSKWTSPTDATYLRTLLEAEKKSKPWAEGRTKPSKADLGLA